MLILISSYDLYPQERARNQMTAAAFQSHKRGKYVCLYLFIYFLSLVCILCWGYEAYWTFFWALKVYSMSLRHQSSWAEMEREQPNCI